MIDSNLLTNNNVKQYIIQSLNIYKSWINTNLSTILLQLKF